MARYIQHILIVLGLALCIIFVQTAPAAVAAEADSDMQYIRVGLLQNQQQVSVSAENDFVVKDLDKKKNYKFNKNKAVQISRKNGRTYIDSKSAGSAIVVAVKDNAAVSVNGKKYRGALRIEQRQNGLTVINRLQIDEYLYGVVPNEMPTDWNGEALKAQAVAARSYALYDKIDGKHARDGFDVCITNDCQVYGGIAAENAAASRAVDATRGVVLTYLGSPICAVFHAASGGSTENSEDVWDARVPYLRAVDDSTERSPYMSWTEKINASDLNEKLGNQRGSLGVLKEIDTSLFKQQAKEDSRGKYIKFIGTSKSVNMSGAAMRSLLGLKSSNFKLSVTENGKVKDGSSLKINKMQSADIIISGKGFGHRLGMSQWGAKSLADKGKNYRQILLHYYTDVQLKSLY